MRSQRSSHSLIRDAGVVRALDLSPATEVAWIEVVQKMESVYADLVQSQVQVEEKNAALEEAQQFIRSVLFSMTDVLVVCDLEGRIQQVNRALERLSGKPASEILGQPLICLFADAAEILSCSNAHQRPEGGALMDHELGLLSAQGDVVPLAVNCSPRVDVDGRPAGMVLLGRPMGELQRAYLELSRTHENLKQAQLQLVQSEKMASLGRLVAGVAHELNNPISFVFGNMHALQNYGSRISRYLSAVDDGVSGEALAQLREELRIDHIMGDMDSLIEGTLEGAERVRDIVQDLLRYATPQQEALCRFDLVEVINTAVEWVTKASRVKPQIDYEMPTTLMLRGCKGHAQQILINLIQNAMDVMDGQNVPRMVIKCHRTESYAVVSIRDHGPGIAESVMTTLFEPFYTTKPVGKGTGLGLSISYGLAVDMGGELTADNHPEGGAVFTLFLPLEGRDDD
ncbi:MAG: ATP-binding protein [Gammaproteobacteria bacterium]|nr:ATP-binding protein [Gammaproteobacteria bacterium]MCF6361909.1 ATP-binding protein [Gammaproteobacteria bacterium]